MTPPNPSDNSISRRKFIKTSALTVGGISLLSSGIALATTSGGGPFDLEGELCSAPTLDDVKDLSRNFDVPIPGIEAGTLNLTLKLMHRCTKLDDPDGTLPYGYSSFSHMAWAEVWSAWGKVGQSPTLLWEFAASYNYGTNVVNISGGLASPSSKLKSTPIWIEDPTKDGGTYCDIEIWAPEPASTEGNGTAAASVSTWVRGSFRVTGEVAGGTPVGQWHLPEGSDELKSTFVAA